MALGRALLKTRPSRPSVGRTVKVMLLITHPMHTGLLKNKSTGEKIPAHYITNVDFFLNGNKFASLEVGAAVSKNPYFAVYLNVTEKGTLKAVYRDNKGKSWSKTRSI